MAEAIATDETGTAKRVIGLTGGIGAGKSTVAAMLAELGATIVDCDELGRLVVEPDGRAYRALVDEFGDGVLQPDGRLDRAALGSIVFNDREALARLNAITHPAIDAEIATLIDAAPGGPIVLDMAVLVESELGRGQYQDVLVVEAPPDTRLTRLKAQRDMAEEDARARIASQATDEQRRAVADHVIVNDGSTDDLAAAVTRFWTEAALG
ncbi:MAG: dephospho-CoA kinase [Acidimicrobiales bacterium]